MSKYSRDKGKRGERMLKAFLNNLGFNTRRGQQYCGSNGDADVVGIDGLHIECKFVEHLNIRDAMEQSTNDARDSETPIVCHKKSRGPWLVTLDARDFFMMWKELHGKSISNS